MIDFKDVFSIDNFKDNRKFILIYLLFILISCISVFSLENYLHPSKEIIILFFLVIFGISIILFYNKNHRELYKVAFVVILIFGLMCVFLSPINSISDEKEHFLRSEITSQGDFFPEYVNEGNHSGYLTIGSLKNTPNDLTVFDTDWDSQSINQSSIYTDSCFVQNPFFGYLAQALGIFLAKLFSLDNIWMLWLGRLFNLLVYTSLATIAIKKTPILKMPMFVVACFPLTIIQAASLSIDSMILGLSLLCLAYIFWMYKAEEKTLTKKHIAIFFILMSILGLLKVTMGALALLFLIIPQKNFKNQKDYYLGFLGIIIVLAILLAWTRIFALDSLTNSWRGELFASQNVDPMGQINYMLHNSQALVTFLQVGNQALTLTDALSRIYTTFPTFPLFNIAYIMFFACLSLFYPLYTKFSRKRRFWLGFTALVLVIGTYFVQYLTWAPVGATNLLDAGVVPRYFIPILVLLPIVFNLNKKNFEIENMDKLVFVCALGFLASIITFIASLSY